MKVDVKVPAVGESITEATIAEWSKNSGDYVERDEILMVLETDKASVEVVAEQAGVLSTQAEEGDVVEIGAVVATIDTEAQPSAKATEAAPGDQAKPQPAQSSAPASQSDSTHPELQQHLSPAVRRVVEEKGLDPSQVTGTGKGGRLTKGDVLQAQPQQAAPKPTAPPTPAPQAKSELPSLPQAKAGGVSEEVERIPMTNIRRRIAERLVEAQQTAAILTTFNEIDMTAVMDLRKRYKDQFKEKYGISLGFMGFFVKAVAEALKAYPRVNGRIEGNDVILHKYQHIGIAVGTPKGLLVPVVRHVDQLSLAEIEQSIRHYAIKARDGKISVDDLSGGTFTISNGGVYGSLMSTPILNPPQSGILGMHKIEERPMAINGKVEIRPMMYVALSYDHRIIDGQESVSFLVRVKECIEDPTRMLLEI